MNKKILSKMKVRTPSIVGFGSVFNLAGASHQVVRLGDASDDFKALRNDWALVGNAIHSAEKNMTGRGTHKTSGTHDAKRSAR
ncbi:MAG: hypothetical protein HGA97_03515 [Chlorobiaceae bacterium]|nr:hypothetical protein [Chlorobiaceae bacterium]